MSIARRGDLGQLKHGEISRRFFDRRTEFLFFFYERNKLFVGIYDFSAKRSRKINNGVAECELDAAITIVLFVKGRKNASLFFSRNTLIILVIFVIPRYYAPLLISSSAQ